MRNTDNIEQFFKETFENFETDVNPQVWTNVQGSIGSAAGSGAAAGAQLALGKILAGVASVAVVAGSIWYVVATQEDNSAPSGSNHNPVQTENSSEKTDPVIVSESKTDNRLSNSHANKQTASTHESPEKNETVEALPQESSTASGTEVVSENSNTENPSSAPAKHKFSNAPRGDGGIMRWNKQENSQSSASGTSADAQEEETSPAANIFVNTTSGDAPLTVEFLNQGAASSTSWDFGDGTSSRESAPVHTFTKAGTYEVELTVKGPSGNSRDKVIIEVKPVSAITYKPNVFTPNGDGENDFFSFETKEIASIAVMIFSRKGATVCSWNKPDGSWNGKLPNGTEAPEGVYFYIITAIGTDGVSHTEKGEINLIK